MKTSDKFTFRNNRNHIVDKNRSQTFLKKTAVEMLSDLLVISRPVLDQSSLVSR